MSSALGNRAIQAAIQAGNVNVAGATQTEEMDLSASSTAEVAAHSEMLRKYEATKRARSMMVPTAVEDVKHKLRELGHPVTMFGEGHFDRRERLKVVVAQLEIEAEQAAKAQGGATSAAAGGGTTTGSSEQNQARERKKEAVYTNASAELIQARTLVAAFSFKRAHERLEGRRQLHADSSAKLASDGEVHARCEHSKTLVLSASAAAEERPLVSVRFSPSGRLLATGSLGASVKLWDAERLEEQGCLRAHEERVMSLAWQPRAGLAADAPELLASASADGQCVLWDCRQCQGQGDAMAVDGAPAPGSAGSRGTRLASLSGHRGPVADCDFHPSGRLLGTAGHDRTWRLWDVETRTELLLQDGHAQECSTIAFQADGALCLTGDGAGVALLWDLRSGQAVHVCQGHVKKITYVLLLYCVLRFCRPHSLLASPITN